MTRDAPILGSLLGADRLDEFLESYWPERIFSVHGDVSRLASALRDVELTDIHALSRRYNGVVSMFGSDQSPNMMPIDGINPAAPYQFGLSVYLADITPYFADVARLLRGLERELGVNEGSARAGLFASPVTSGISRHYDAVDIFSIQLRGAKRFDIAPVSELPRPSGHQYIPGNRPIDDLYPQAGGGFPHWHDARFESVEMLPGSVLFMPRGTWHLTEASEDSFAVSIGVSPPSAAQCVLEQLRLLMLQDPEWRRPLYGAWGEGDARRVAHERAGELLADLPRLASALQVDMLTLPSQSEAVRIAAVDSRSRFQRAPDTELHLDTDAPNAGGTVVAHIRSAPNVLPQVSTQVEMPVRYLPLMRWLAERRESYTLAELEERFSELDAQEHRELAQALARAKFVKLLWFPPLA